ASDGAALVALHQVLQRAAELSALDPSLAERIKPLQEAKALLEDATFELREYGRQLEADPEQLAANEERLSALRKLQKKFGRGVEDILRSLAEITAEIESLEMSDETLKSLATEEAELLKSLTAMAKDLHKRRENGAELLQQGVNDELLDLNMKGVSFSVN